MFGQKYTRTKFWIISICLIIPTAVLNSLAKVLYAAGNDGTAIVFYTIVFIFGLTWLNTLANRIRDYGGNPWFALLAFIPLVNLMMAFYYGIAKGSSDSTNSEQE